MAGESTEAGVRRAERRGGGGQVVDPECCVWPLGIFVRLEVCNIVLVGAGQGVRTQEAGLGGRKIEA